MRTIIIFVALVFACVSNPIAPADAASNGAKSVGMLLGTQYCTAYDTTGNVLSVTTMSVTTEPEPGHYVVDTKNKWRYEYYMNSDGQTTKTVLYYNGKLYEVIETR